MPKLLITIATLIAASLAQNCFAQSQFTRTPQLYRDSYRPVYDRDRLDDYARARHVANRIPSDYYSDRQYAASPVDRPIRRTSCNVPAYARQRARTAYRPNADGYRKDVYNRDVYNRDAYRDRAYYNELRAARVDPRRSSLIVPANFYTGKNLYGQPSVFTKDEPVRNFFRSLIP